MSAPSPFFVAREIGTNIAGAAKQSRDNNAIENILAQASQSGDPRELQGAIGKILSQVSPSRQADAIRYLEGTYKRIQERQEQQRQQQAARKIGVDADLSPALQTEAYKQNQKNQRINNAYGPSIQNPQKPNEQIKNSPQQSGLKGFSDDRLIQLSGHPDREVAEPAKQELKNRQAERKQKKAGDEFATIREKGIADYVNNAITQGEEADSLKYSLATVRKAINGDIAGPGLEAAAKNNPYLQIVLGLTPDESTLQAANKKLLEGTKSIFGSKPTEREIFLLLNSMLPSIGKSKEANLASLDFIDRVNNLKILHSDIVDELTEGGTKFVPDLERQVNAKLKPIGENLRNDLKKAVEKYGVEPKKEEKIRVKAPNGTIGNMTQKQIDEAKANNVIFEPVK